MISTPHPTRPRALLIGEEAGITALITLAREMVVRPDTQWQQPLVLLGSETIFPFRPRPSRIVVAGIPEGTIACVPVLDEQGIGSRLASRSDLPGCFDGSVVELAEIWLQSLDRRGLSQVEIFAAGPVPLLEAAAQLAERFGLPCRAG